MAPLEAVEPVVAVAEQPFELRLPRLEPVAELGLEMLLDVGERREAVLELRHALVEIAARGQLLELPQARRERGRLGHEPGAVDT